MTGSKEAQLSRAAKALVEAASLEADSMTQKQLSQSLNSLKDSFQKELSKSTKSTNDLAQKFDDKINTVNQNIDKLFSEVKRSNDLSEKQLKLKRLELALANTSVDSFEYSYDMGYGRNRNSSEFAKTVIGNFMFEYGTNISTEYHIRNDRINHHREATDVEKKYFRDALVKQIKRLIGREPRLGDNGNGKYAIYYE